MSIAHHFIIVEACSSSNIAELFASIWAADLSFIADFDVTNIAIFVASLGSRVAGTYASVLALDCDLLAIHGLGKAVHIWFLRACLCVIVGAVSSSSCTESLSSILACNLGFIAKGFIANIAIVITALGSCAANTDTIVLVACNCGLSTEDVFLSEAVSLFFLSAHHFVIVIAVLSSCIAVSR